MKLKAQIQAPDRQEGEVRGMLNKLRAFFYGLFRGKPRYITFEGEYEVVYLLRQIEQHLQNIEINTRKDTRRFYD